MNKYVLVSKDAMAKDYLPIYGNKLWRTPNIDALAKKGTVFNHYFTAAPSTVMSFFSMVTGQYAHETAIETYEKNKYSFNQDTIFRKLSRKEIKSYILWDSFWNVLPRYFDVYHNDVTFCDFDSFRQGVGAHYLHKEFLIPDKGKEESTKKKMLAILDDLLNKEEDAFIWIHFPHVINGKVAYGSDIELFDEYIGCIRSRVSDDCIAITSDHGNMNGHKGKISYGHDVYNPNIEIPLITPRINGLMEYDGNVSSVNLFDILFDGKIIENKFIYSDSAYRAQPNRKLAIVYDKYKYIYNKKTKTEELYDLQFDPMEEFSLMDDYIFDVDRQLSAPSRELYYYPEWDALDEVRHLLRDEKNQIWKDGNRWLELKNKAIQIIRPLYDIVTRKK